MTKSKPGFYKPVESPFATMKHTAKPQPRAPPICQDAPSPYCVYLGLNGAPPKTLPPGPDRTLNLPHRATQPPPIPAPISAPPSQIHLPSLTRPEPRRGPFRGGFRPFLCMADCFFVVSWCCMSGFPCSGRAGGRACVRVA